MTTKQIPIVGNKEFCEFSYEQITAIQRKVLWDSKEELPNKPSKIVRGD